MDKTPKVSLIVPVRNSAKEILPFFDCLSRETFKDFQVLFSYGTSNDGTQEILLNAIKSHPEIRCSFHDCALIPVGPSKNYWLDSSLEQSDYDIFLDIDDRPKPDYLTKLVEAAPKADLIQCGFSRIEDKTGRLISEDQIHNPIDLQDIFSNPGLVYIHTATWNKLFKRSLIGDDVRFPDGRKFEDLVFVMEYLAHCQSIHSINEPLYDYVVATNTRSAMRTKEELRSSNSDVQNSLLALRSFYLLHRPEAVQNGFLDALVFLRYGIGFTTRMCLSHQEKRSVIIKNSRLFLDQNFPQWRTSKILGWSSSHHFGAKTWFVRWCRRLYKAHCFGLFVFCYRLFTRVFHKDIKP